MNAQDGQDLQDFLSTDTDCISVGSCCSSPDFYPPFSSPACVSPLALSCQMKKRLSPLAPPAPSRVPEGGMQLTAAAAGTGRFHHRSALCCATQVCPPEPRGARPRPRPLPDCVPRHLVKVLQGSGATLEKENTVKALPWGSGGCPR